MRRRDVLRAAGGTFALGTVGTVPSAANASQESYGPLGSISIDGATEAVVGDEGSVAYVAATTGFATVDISTPSEPEILAEQRDILADRETGPLSTIHDVKVEGDRLVVAGPANAKQDALSGFALYDVSDPASPELLAFHETDYPLHNCFVRDGIVYLTANDTDRNPLVMVDVSGDEPEEVGRWSILDHDEAWGEVDWFLRVLHDVWVQDGIAYLAQWDAGTWIVDVSDPANPEFVSNIRADRREALAQLDEQEAINTEAIEPPGNDHYTQVSEDGTLLAIGMESWDRGSTEDVGGPSGIELWDISDPGSPERRSRIEPPPTLEPTIGGVWTTSHNFELAGDRLYSAWYQGGVKIFDVSDPANPEELIWWRDPEQAAFWTARLAIPSTGEDDGFFVASSYGVSNGIEEGLFTFPDRAGQQADPPSLTDTEEAGATANGTGTPTGTPVGAARPGETATDTATTTASDGQPGFGFAVGLAGLAGGAWKLLDRE